jgi:hypothetical protein
MKNHKRPKSYFEDICLSHEKVERCNSDSHPFEMMGDTYEKIEHYLNTYGQLVDGHYALSSRPGVKSEYYGIFHLPKATVHLEAVKVIGGVGRCPEDFWDLNVHIRADSSQMASTIARKIKSLDEKLEDMVKIR